MYLLIHGPPFTTTKKTRLKIASDDDINTTVPRAEEELEQLTEKQTRPQVLLKQCSCLRLSIVLWVPLA